MKVLYCIDGLCLSGGTERVLTTKVNWLAEHGVDVSVVTLKENRKPFFHLSTEVKRVMLDVLPGDRLKYRSQLSLLLTELQPDVTVCVQGMAMTELPRCTDGSLKVLEFHYTRNFLVNFVKGLHHMRFRQLHLIKMRWMQWRLAMTARRYDVFVGLTARDVALWGHPENMTYIYNPLSFRSEKVSTCRSKRIIAVGSWTPAKGMDQLLMAFGSLAVRYPDWRVDLFGAGQDEAYLRQIIKKFDMAPQVELHPPHQNIGEELIGASIYAFPSRSDGFGLVITEAMECGLPTVAMDCECGPREILSAESGMLVPDGDVHAFASALERLMVDEELRRRMGAAAKREAVRFYPDNIMPMWLNLFERRV